MDDMDNDNLYPDYRDRIKQLGLQGMRQYYVDCGKHRLETLLDLCVKATQEDNHGVIYCQTFETVLLVADHLRLYGLEALSLNASEEFLSETRLAIRDFRDEEEGFLVTTQIPLIFQRSELLCDIPLIIHYDTPKTHEDSLARMGRKRRTVRRSTSIMLIKDDNDKKFIQAETEIFRQTVELLPDDFADFL
jgi:superfamily II DNA/RNA helicase